MYEDEADKIPVDPIKSFNQINFENESIEVFLFDGVKRFLYNFDRLSNLAVFEKSILFLRDARVQVGFDSHRDYFGY